MTNESKDSINNVFSEMFNENWENKSISHQVLMKEMTLSIK
jgi:hypothetical protein